MGYSGRTRRTNNQSNGRVRNKTQRNIEIQGKDKRNIDIENGLVMVYSEGSEKGLALVAKMFFPTI